MYQMHLRFLDKDAMFNPLARFLLAQCDDPPVFPDDLIVVS